MEAAELGITGGDQMDEGGPTGGMGAAGHMAGGGVGNPMAGMTGMDPMSRMMEGMMRGGPPGGDDRAGANGRPIGPGPPGSADPAAMVSPTFPPDHTTGPPLSSRRARLTVAPVSLDTS